MTAFARCWSRLRSATGLLTIGLFLAFVVGQAPHLVHHLFEPEHTRADCAFASSAERSHALTVDVVTLFHAGLLEPAAPAPDRASLPSATLSPDEARAPPLSVA